MTNKFFSIIALVLVVGTVSTSLLLYPLSANALVTGFGGRSVNVTYCSCTPGCSKVVVLWPRGGQFMWCPWTRFYEFYKIYPPSWQLGTYFGWMACMQVKGNSCDSDGGGFLMMIDGTSVY